MRSKADLQGSTASSLVSSYQPRQFVSAGGKRILEAKPTTGQPTTTFVCKEVAVNYKTPAYWNLEAISPQLDPKTVCGFSTSNKTIEMFREVREKERMS